MGFLLHHRIFKKMKSSRHIAQPKVNSLNLWLYILKNSLIMLLKQNLKYWENWKSMANIHTILVQLNTHTYSITHTQCSHTESYMGNSMYIFFHFAEDSHLNPSSEHITLALCASVSSSVKEDWQSHKEHRRQCVWNIWQLSDGHC